ncbi:hypothetical protein [Stenotrophomonas sp. ATs4]|uniref:hypothetical protein n=1 Tax=Stenotrophomonas sp. ATs4 TaxID=3402766 RepID=UPI003F70894D
MRPAALLNSRFKLARKRLGFNAQNSHWPKLDCSRFQKPLPPKKDTPQGSLFWNTGPWRDPPVTIRT